MCPAMFDRDTITFSRITLDNFTLNFTYQNQIRIKLRKSEVNKYLFVFI